MTQEEKSLLIKDLCERLPYGVRCYPVFSVSKPNTIGGYCDALDDFYIREVDGWFNVSMIKPYLRSLSSMTEEEKDELHDWGWEYTGNDIITGGSTDADNFYKVYEKNLYDLKWLADWLNAHYFDYRNLIEKGLAIEAPEDMYNINEK